MRVPFCGVIEGSVAVRNGETATQAIQRAEDTINDILCRSAKRFTREGDMGLGPIVGLEPNEPDTID